MWGLKLEPKDLEAEAEILVPETGVLRLESWGLKLWS